MKINLKAKIREVIGKKVKKFRKQDLIPAVIYGNKIKPQNLWVNYLDFRRVYDQAGESTIIEIDIDNAKHSVLVHEVQNDNMSGKFSHIDFFQVNMKEELETEIPLEFVGESEAVKSHGGVLIKNMDAIEVKCLPADLPAHFEVDLSKLKTFEDHFTVADLKVSEKVEILIEPETVIALVVAPRTEAEMDSLETKVEEDVSKVEGVVKEETASSSDNK